jgi:hypothetical protein
LEKILKLQLQRLMAGEQSIEFPPFQTNDGDGP